jgi:hypothetical protein
MTATPFTLIGGQKDHPQEPPTNNEDKGSNNPKGENFLAIFIVFASVIVIAAFTIKFGWVGALSMAILASLVIYGSRKFNEARDRQPNNQ